MRILKSKVNSKIVLSNLSEIFREIPPNERVNNS